VLLPDLEPANDPELVDDADALLGGRSEVTDANDRYTNMEIDCLLQRIEAHDGLVILASNFRSSPADTTANDAWPDRLSQVVHFPRPRR
jgi:hypothetical protein